MPGIRAEQAHPFPAACPGATATAADAGNVDDPLLYEAKVGVCVCVCRDVLCDATVWSAMCFAQAYTRDGAPSGVPVFHKLAAAP